MHAVRGYAVTRMHCRPPDGPHARPKRWQRMGRSSARAAWPLCTPQKGESMGSTFANCSKASSVKARVGVAGASHGSLAGAL